MPHGLSAVGARVSNSFDSSSRDALATLTRRSSGARFSKAGHSSSLTSGETPWLAIQERNPPVQGLPSPRLGASRLAEQLEQGRFVLRQSKYGGTAAPRPFCRAPYCPEDEFAHRATVLRSSVTPVPEISRDDRIRRRSLVAGRGYHLSRISIAACSRAAGVIG